MTARARLLAAAAAAHTAWLDEHADQVPAVPGDSAPHDGPGGPSDYAEHHADRSAPAAVDDLLSAQLARLLGGDAAAGPGGDQDDEQDGEPVGTEETAPIVDDAADVILAEGWEPPVPNVLLDLREAGSDRKLRKYWVSGPGAAKINWGAGGDFDRCVSHLAKYVSRPEGLCNEYHQAALGAPPGKGH